MADPADIPRVLLGLARDDELAARALLPVEGVTDAILGFHAQQAVEKSLKAVLALRGVEFPYTHDLDGLLELCQKNALDDRSRIESCASGECPGGEAPPEVLLADFTPISSEA